MMGADAKRAAIMGAAPEEAGILLFGTHGVIPETKEISYLVEPALVLSPSQSDPEEDGLLLASQVAALRLDNSWLAILAACRTGTPSGTDVSDGLTGLALGFTAAGTDALLVTQWSIYPGAAREVVLTMLQRMAADSELTLSAALDDAMRAHMETHPDTIEWAGFTILGDGTVTMPPL
ncbi:MAG: CHAT domain-containing protein [Thiohalocapsa sp. PB-PSB1]|nr:MAG: CHAT domain-containing protein [Thiohalocapsa sp. PB-PSB1]